MPKKTSGKRVNRTNQTKKWLADMYGDIPYVRLNAVQIAKLASGSLNFQVSPNTVCRILMKLGVKFKGSPDDPTPRVYSKVDLLKARVDHLEDRLKRVEKRK